MRIKKNSYAHVEMIDLIGAENNTMIGINVVVAVSVSEALAKKD